jgi:hypothetical protein
MKFDEEIFSEFGDAIADIFYRETPHPEFGNKYFCLFFRGDDMYVANADYVEKLTFGMVENDEGESTKLFTIHAIIDNETHGIGRDYNKKAAEKLAAEKACESLAI